MREVRVAVIIIMTALALSTLFPKNRNVIEKEDSDVNIIERHSENKIDAEMCELTKEQQEFDCFTRCVQAEAGNQGFNGKRFVAAVILNRVESEKFPNTISEVVYDKGQFAVAWNGAMKKAEVDEETVLACRIEMAHRCNTEILYFNNSENVSGKFAFKYGGHWFGK